MNNNNAYVPGVCNLNNAETKHRQLIAYIGAAIYVLLFIFLVFFQDVYFFRLFLFFPALMFAVGYVQAKSHFCVAYGTSGKQNATPGNIIPEIVEDNDARKKDRAYSQKLLFKAGLIAAGFLVVGLICPPY